MLRYQSPHRLRVFYFMCLIALLALAVTVPICASTLSIVSPLQKLVDALTGPVAVSLAMLVLVSMGIALGFGRVEFQTFAMTSSVTVLLLGIVFLARPFLRDLFGTPATPAAALLGF